MFLRVAKRAKRRPGEVVDASAMRALAHPLKWALMEVLLVDGPATSTRCAELVGESQANCSFHLRQLARYGLVEEAPTTSKRERPWRLATTEQSWSLEQPDDSTRQAAGELERVFIQHEMAKLMRWRRSQSEYPREWRCAALRAGATTWLTAEELKELSEELWRVMVRFRDRLEGPDRRPPGSRPVRLFAVGYPLPEDTEK
jgi:predicted ArsR family transcriptional regulator